VRFDDEIEVEVRLCEVLRARFWGETRRRGPETGVGLAAVRACLGLLA
jgi:hypothetical protein